MFAFTVSSKIPRPKFKRLCDNVYFVVRPSRPSVSPARMAQDGCVIMSPRPLPGMKNMTSSSEEDRTTFVVDLELLLTGVLGDSAGAIQDLRPCYSLHQFNQAKETILKTRKQVLSSIKPSGTTNLRHVEIQIGLFIQSSLQLLESEMEYLQSDLAKKTKFTSTLFEWQIGQAYFRLDHMLEIATGAIANDAMDIPLYGNNSKLLNSMPDSGKNLRVARASVNRSAGEGWGWLVLPINGALMSTSNVTKVVTAIKSFYLNDALTNVRRLSDLTNKLHFQYYDRFNPSLGGISPIMAAMKTYHVQSWDTYALPEQLEGSSALRLPIWVFNWPRQASFKIPADEYNQVKNLMISDQSKMASHPPSLALRKAKFLMSLFSDAVHIFFSQMNPAEPLSEACASLRKWMGAKVYPDQQLEPFTPEDRLNLVALTDFVGFVLTYAALNGKYRSDIGVDEKTDKLTGSESCDLNRYSGHSCSGDCEECEGVTREVYLMLCDFEEVVDSLPDVHSYGMATGDVQRSDVKLISKWIRENYEYLSISGASTAAFPGMDVDDELAALDYDALLEPPRSNSSRNGPQQMSSNRSVNFIRKLKHGSATDLKTVPSFHQYSLLLPVVTAARLVLGTNGARPESRVGKKWDFPEDVKDYYKQRLASCCQKDGFVTPPMLLESTSPVSTLLMGASVNVGLPADHKVTVEAAKFDEYIVRKTTDFKKQLLVLSQPYSEDPRARDTHALRRILSSARSAVDSDSRYTTTFYRHVCHAVNVTFIDQTMKRARKSDSGLTELSILNRVGAMSYLTFIDGPSDNFGVVLEDLLLGHLPVGKHPMSVATPHLAVSPLSDFPESMWTEMDSYFTKMQLSERLPPVLFNVQGDPISGEFRTGNYTPNRDNQFYPQVFCTQIALLRGVPEKTPVLKVEEFDNTAATDLAAKIAQAAGATYYKRVLVNQLYPTFGPHNVWISVDAVTKMVDPRKHPPPEV